MQLKPGDLFYYGERDASLWMMLVTRVGSGRAYITLLQLKPRAVVYGTEMLYHISLDAVIEAGWKHVA